MNRNQVLYLSASICLDYPDEALLAKVPQLRAALNEHPRLGEPFQPVLTELERARQGIAPLRDLQASYVQEIDLSRRHALHLSYWTDGDTRRRGEMLAAFKSRYRRAGMLVDTHGELPDYLPMVLEYAALADLEGGRELLIQYRPSLEMLRLGLLDDNLPHAHILAAICDSLPGKSHTDRQAIMRMAGLGPPTETVGLDAQDPRLLPLQGR
jgi:nitrate reductase delta subunit